MFKLQVLVAFLFAAFVYAAATPEPEAEFKLNARALDEILQVRQEIAGIGNFLGQLTGLLPALLQLLNAQTLNNIKSLVDNASFLLAQPTANQTKALIGTVDGMLGSLGPLLDGIGPLLASVGPLLASIGPLMEGLGDLITPDMIQKIGGLLDAVFSLLTPEFVAQITGLINDVAPLISAVAQLITGLISAVLGG